DRTGRHVDEARAAGNIRWERRSITEQIERGSRQLRDRVAEMEQRDVKRVDLVARSQGDVLLRYTESRDVGDPRSETPANELRTLIGSADVCVARRHSRFAGVAPVAVGNDSQMNEWVRGLDHVVRLVRLCSATPTRLSARERSAGVNSS